MPFLLTLLQLLGFDYFAFLIQHPMLFTRPGIHLRNMSAKLWLQRHQQQKYFNFEPFFAGVSGPLSALNGTPIGSAYRSL